MQFEVVEWVISQVRTYRTSQISESMETGEKIPTFNEIQDISKRPAFLWDIFSSKRYQKKKSSF